MQEYPKREAIILAGGLGTRLKEAVPDLPKAMAPVAGRPFLFHIINYLRSQWVGRFIFSLGYRHEVIIEYLREQYPTLDYEVVIEEEPMGTGGGIRLACEKAKARHVVVANADTLFKANLDEMFNLHEQKNAFCTLALKPMRDFDRYGVVELGNDHSVTAFQEKKFYPAGLINGGLYILDVEKFTKEFQPAKFSFETDFLERACARHVIFGLEQGGYFIDIGIPSDFLRAQKDLEAPPLALGQVGKTWTLFIDRDGVINHEKKDGYILNWGEFRFYDGVKEAFRVFSQKFGKIIIVSNQRGVGRQLMTEEDLLDIHSRMKSGIEESGGRIDGIYYCTSTDNLNLCRKPNPGMAFQARNDFQGIDPSQSIMVGNKPSDMLFGRYAGLFTVFLRTTNPDTAFPHPDIDLVFNSLADFAKAL